jgi:replicative superfamily II helicase
VQLIIIDEIHLLGVDRGPVLVSTVSSLWQRHLSLVMALLIFKEILVSRMRYVACQTMKSIRFVGLSTALANPRDLADWLGIGSVGVYK